MSERYCAWIRIGGSIERTRAQPLITEIRQTGVRTDWGEPLFEPQTADDLLAARTDGWLWLCDEEARYGEFPELEETCRKLGLGYTRFCEAWCGFDAERVDFRPGMEEPSIRTCSNEDSELVFVPLLSLKESLELLESGRVQEAIRTLRHLCVEIPDLPPFVIV